MALINRPTPVKQLETVQKVQPRPYIALVKLLSMYLLRASEPVLVQLSG